MIAFRHHKAASILTAAILCRLSVWPCAFAALIFFEFLTALCRIYMHNHTGNYSLQWILQKINGLSYCLGKSLIHFDNHRYD